jgi:hypothetical protein
MGLPVFSKSELDNAARRDDLIKETAAQIIKDFGEFNLDIDFSGDSGSFYDELSKQMVVHVSELIQSSQTRFLALLYRIDIGNKDIELYQEEMIGQPYPAIITELIIHRELKKVLTRDYFRRNSSQ